MSPDPASVQRWKCLCAYDGGQFSGWQSQVDGNAVQDVIERRLRAIFGRDIRIHGSGRTDAGVHALGQVFHFDASWKHAPDRLLAALRAGTPGALQIRSVDPAPATFHARFSATGKRYEYRISLGDADPFTRPYAWSVFRPLDIPAMTAAASLLCGKHDFRAFTALNGPARSNTVRDLRRLTVVRRGPRLRITAEADGFLYKMVRSLVGALESVGEGRLGLDQLAEILRARVRTPAVQTAPSHGLFLQKVFYGRRGVRPAASESRPDEADDE